MSRRFSRIQSSARLRPALDKYIAYLNGTATRTSRVGTQGARGNTKVVYVTPFAFDLPANTSVKSTVAPDDYTRLAPFINAGGTGGEVTDAAAGDIESRNGFSAARVIFLFNNSRSVSKVTSEITGLPYLKYAAQRFSCPFGRKAATDDMVDTFDDIKTAILAANQNAAVKRVSLQKEKYAY